MADAYELLPFAETLVLLRLNSSHILRALEQVLTHAISNGGGTGGYPYASGLRFAVNASAPAGRRISGVGVNARLQAGWSALDPAATYALVTNSFIAKGKDGYALLGEVRRREDTFNDQAQAFISYLSAFEGEECRAYPPRRRPPRATYRGRGATTAKRRTAQRHIQFGRCQPGF